MAVTLTTADLQQPAGELTESLFPGSNFSSLLVGWLAQAKAKVEGDGSIAPANHNAAAAAWVYYRAFSHKAALQANTPNQVNFSNQPGVSKTMAADQREYFVNLANQWLATFSGYVAATASAMGSLTGSQMLNTLPRW